MDSQTVYTATTREALAAAATSWTSSLPCTAFGLAQAAKAAILTGVVPRPRGLTPAQTKLFDTTCGHLYVAVGQIMRACQMPDPEATRVLLRTAVAMRLAMAPGESPLIKTINAIRGERRRSPHMPVEVLWPQMSFPGGVCDAALDALVELRRHVGPEVQAAAEMDAYQAELQRLRMTATRAPRDRRV